MLNTGSKRRTKGGPKMGRRVVGLAALVSLWVLGPAATAVADPPDQQEFVVEFSGPHFLSNVCGSTILQEGTAHIARTAFDDGRLIEHIDLDLALTASGKVAFEHAQFNVVVDSAGGTATLTGTLVDINAPGAGLLLQEVGRIVQDLATGDPLFSAGRFMIMQGEVAELCSFFAGA